MGKGKEDAWGSCLGRVHHRQEGGRLEAQVPGSEARVLRRTYRQGLRVRLAPVATTTTVAAIHPFGVDLVADGCPEEPAGSASASSPPEGPWIPPKRRARPEGVEQGG